MAAPAPLTPQPFNPNIPRGAIPGANYTRDTRNFPWHRPPDITDIDTGIESCMKKLTTKDTSYALLTMLQLGVNVVQATDIFVTSGISQGKWTPDFALLLAGPVSNIIKLMADGYGIKYDMGLEDKPMPSKNYFTASQKIDPNKAVKVADAAVSQADQFKAKAEQQNPAQAQQLLGSDPQNPMSPSGLMGASGPGGQPQPPPSAPPGQATPPSPQQVFPQPQTAPGTSPALNAPPSDPTQLGQ